MEPKDLEYFKELLTQQLQELLQQAGHAVVQMRDADESLADPLDRAAYEYDQNNQLRIRDRESRLIKKIRESLQDIEEGTFGICVMCGEDIGIARLKARPVAKHCIKCKTRLESLERVVGV
jgi:DnaK suppressor protein